MLVATLKGKVFFPLMLDATLFMFAAVFKGKVFFPLMFVAL